jgi:hypothetical protein
VRVRLLLADGDSYFEDSDVVMRSRQEADESYEAIGQDMVAGDARLVQRRRWRGCCGPNNFTTLTCGPA